MILAVSRVAPGGRRPLFGRCLLGGRRGLLRAGRGPILRSILVAVVIVGRGRRVAVDQGGKAVIAGRSVGLDPRRGGLEGGAGSEIGGNADHGRPLKTILAKGSARTRPVPQRNKTYYISMAYWDPGNSATVEIRALFLPGGKICRRLCRPSKCTRHDCFAPVRPILKVALAGLLGGQSHVFRPRAREAIEVKGLSVPGPLNSGA